VKECIGALAATAALLIASVALARQDKFPAYKYQGEARVYAELAKAPEKARAKRNPLENDPEAVAAGRNLFEQHCSECHGSGGEGSRKAPSLRVGEVQNAAPGAIFWLVTNGVVRRGMPVWSKLPEPQRWQLVSYIRSLGTSSASSLQQKSP
jgi:mono/diheme cytochrome c family protein